MTDVDGNVEEKGRTVSVFNGPQPTIKIFKSEKEESQYVSQWISNQLKEAAPHEIGVFVRSSNQMDRAIDAVNKANGSFTILDENSRNDQ